MMSMEGYSSQFPDKDEGEAKKQPDKYQCITISLMRNCLDGMVCSPSKAESRFAFS